ncbi:MAG: response regulator [Lachnospiraceae bacterium]|nr:response regulator [Lachnospiraceae bacterium]
MKHILMVDDVTTNLKSAAEVLQPFYHLSMAKSGKQALNFLKKNRPDLILLDIMMPEMDGYDTMEQIKLNPRTANIPIIFLTADTEQESEIRGMKMGAMDFITKPFEAEAMLGRIEKVLQMEDMRKNILSSAKRDLLTDLWKAEYLEPEIDSRLKHISDTGATMLLIDFDDFKSFAAGGRTNNADGVIIRFCESLRKIVPADTLLGRIGKDRFLLFIPYGLNEIELMGLCTDIRDVSLREANNASSADTTLTVSISIALAPQHGLDYASLTAKLDMAMYYIKQTGKDQIHIYRGA